MKNKNKLILIQNIYDLLGKINILVSGLIIVYFHWQTYL